MKVDYNEINYEELLDSFNDYYKMLYESESYIAGYDEALDYFNNTVMENNDLKKVLNEFVEVRRDYVSSDRECVAFVLALEDLGVLDSLNL